MRVLLAIVVAAAVSLAALAETKQAPQIEYPKTADYLIFELDGKGGYRSIKMEDLLAGTIPDHPAFQVFGNGRAVIYIYDRKMETRFSETELNVFIETLLTLGVHELESEDVAAKRKSADEERFQKTGVVGISADTPTYELTFQLAGYAPQAGVALRPIKKKFSWRSVSTSARRYPRNAEIQNLAALEDLVGELSQKIVTANAQNGEQNDN